MGLATCRGQLNISYLSPNAARCNVCLLLCDFSLQELQLIHVAPLLLDSLSALGSLLEAALSLLTIVVCTCLLP